MIKKKGEISGVSFTAFGCYLMIFMVLEVGYIRSWCHHLKIKEEDVTKTVKAKKNYTKSYGPWGHHPACEPLLLLPTSELLILRYHTCFHCPGHFQPGIMLLPLIHQFILFLPSKIFFI